MTLSKRGDYVVRSALSLARAWPSGGPRKIREVVAEMGVPQTYASQILAELVKAGLAVSKAGKDGGYWLSRSPDEIPLIQVVEAGEGPLKAERCALGDGPCRWDDVCPLHETWRDATEALRGALEQTSLGDLARRDREIEAGHLEPVADSHRHGGSSIHIEDVIQVEAGVQFVSSWLEGQEHLGSAIEQAYGEAEGLRAQILAGEVAWTMAQVVATCSRNKGKGRLPGAPGPDRQVFDTSWEATGHDATTSRGDAELLVDTVDEDRSNLVLQGRFRPPRPAGGTCAGGSEVIRLSQVLVRTLLRRMAREIEELASTTGVAASERGRRRHSAPTGRVSTS
ncbi:MAG: RrF2 family transcriptional regulator [Acidimicrobiales bacterium]